MNNCMGTMPKVHSRSGHGILSGWLRFVTTFTQFGWYYFTFKNSLHKVSLSTDDKDLTKQNFKMFLRIVNGGSARSVKLYIHTSWPVNLFTF